QAVRFQLGHDHGLPIVRDFAHRSKNKGGEFYKSREYLQMFNASGTASGKVVTLGSLVDLAIKRGKGWIDPDPTQNPNHNPALKEDATPEHNTEVGMAEFIMRKYESRLLYIMDLELWYFWDGKVWQRDDDAYSLNK